MLAKYVQRMAFCYNDTYIYKENINDYMNNPKISVIVPVYNVEPYIRECFSSIVAQTYKGEIECVSTQLLPRHFA